MKRKKDEIEELNNRVDDIKAHFNNINIASIKIIKFLDRITAVEKKMDGVRKSQDKVEKEMYDVNVVLNAIWDSHLFDQYRTKPYARK